MATRHSLRAGGTFLGRCIALAFLALSPAATLAQAPPIPPGVNFRVEGASQQLEMIVNTSRILSLDKKVPRALVNNPDIVKVTPLSPNQIQVSAIKAGVTQVNLWDEAEGVHTVDIVVTADGRELERLLKTEFPEAAIKVRPLASSVVISGYVPRPDSVSRIVRMAEDYYPKVINNMTVGGVQQVALKVKVMEVSRSKLRKLGFDWALLNGDDFVYSNASGLIQTADIANGAVAWAGDTVSFGVLTDNNRFFGFIEALRKHNLVKVMAEPTLVTVSGRPASFNSGGQFPIIIPQSLGTVSVEYRSFGTRVDFVPIVLGNGNIRLEVRPSVSEIDSARSVTVNNTTVPGLRERWVDTAAEMKAGQTLALAGLIQERTEIENKGLPWLADMPWAGAAFRREQEQINEVELLILVTPELIDAVDPHEVPACGPGEMTASPSDTDLYFRGYMEVPKCNGPCAFGECQEGQGLQAPAPVMNQQAPTQAPPKWTTGPSATNAPRNLPARPVATNVPPRPVVGPAPTPAAPANGGRPQLLGPVGYDVLE